MAHINEKTPIVIVGVGYVGLPLACLLATRYRVIGLDIDEGRVQELNSGYDRTDEVPDAEKLRQKNLSFSTDAKVIENSRFIIITVPTPVDDFNKPDLGPLLAASKTVGQHLQKGSIVVYESTVYPGCTENECRKVLEQYSGLSFQQDFELGYSPERVNPGDRKNTIDKITKIVSGSSQETLEIVAEVYGSVVTGGIHRAPSLATAEAAKIIENTQRDVNIALMNELAVIFEKIGLDTQDVLKAARTKWNWNDYTPGLVGGHCIGVDPYYLTYMAEGLGVTPQVILASRKINDNMSTFVAQKLIKMLLNQKKSSKNPLRVAVCGMTFKENVPDLRNSKVMDLVTYLEEFGVQVFCFDPVADAKEFREMYGHTLSPWNELPLCNAIVVAVKHESIKNEITLDKILQKLEPESRILMDLKGLYDRHAAEKLGMSVWRM